MLENLDKVPWAQLEHAFGFADDVPDLLHKLRVDDPKVRDEAMLMLYGNVFHQGSRFPATPYVVPFLIELCSSNETPNREDLLRYWKSLITGYFSVQERPIWGDGENIFYGSEIQNDEPFAEAIHQIYIESLKGHDLLLQLVHDDVPVVRAASAGVLACLPTVAAKSIGALKRQLESESVGRVRAAFAFALGELGCDEPLRNILAHDSSPEARCVAACELARIAPDASLVEHLLPFVAESIEGYPYIPGTGDDSCGDAAHAISDLPKEIQLQAAPAICERLKQLLLFQTIPLVKTLLSAAFERQSEPLTELNDAQRTIMRHLVDCQELWSVWNLSFDFDCYGLPFSRRACAELIGVKFVDDAALAALSSGIQFSKMGFLDKARENIELAVRHDPLVFETAPSPELCWFYSAKAYAETDPAWALEAYQRATAINPAIACRVDPTWRLYQLLSDEGD